VKGKVRRNMNGVNWTKERLRNAAPDDFVRFGEALALVRSLVAVPRGNCSMIPSR